jgi:TolB-like protein/DNA-binding winged helix-turn-helix (wHTH) protein/tetratricopeptide (TPR) repeat protein
MQVLVALARANGEVVSRDDLIETCRIVGEDSIGRCIARLRKTAEASRHAFTIETVARVGYRLKIAGAAASAPDATGSATPEADSIASDRAAPPPPAQAALPVRTVRPLAAVAAGILVVLMTGFGIWWLWPRPAAPPAEPATSVAVLPFVNMSGDPAKEYFSDGFSEELLNDLSSDPRLRVVARTSAFAFKGKTGDTQAIARTLHVHAIVEGSIREAANRVRIDAELIDPTSGYRIWSAAYDRNLADILSVQDEVARAIAAALTHQLLPAPSMPRPKIDPAVYRLYLEGIHQFDLGPPQGWRKAFAIFNQVTVGAPDFADGFAWFSLTANNLAVNYDAAPAANLALASDAAQRALSLDPHNIMARDFHAMVALETWNWRGAAAGLHALRNQNPNNLFTIGGLWNYYGDLGFPDEAFAEWHHLYATDPHTYKNSYTTILALEGVGRSQEEIEVANTQLVGRPRDTSRLEHLCRAYAARGQVAQARAVDEHLRSLQTDFDTQTDFQRCDWSIDIAAGNRAAALRLLHIWESEFPDKFAYARIIAADYVLLGNFDKATDWFERAYERREPSGFFASFDLRGIGYEKAFEKYRVTAAYKVLAEKPLFKEWQAEHDRVAAELAARGGAP